MMHKQINKILFITLSNLGDVILTTPVFSLLKEEFPDATITVMVGPRAKEIFTNDLRVNRLIIYEKSMLLTDKIKLIRSLRKEKYDLAVDLRNTLIPLLAGAVRRTGIIRFRAKKARHKRNVHLERLRSLRFLNPGRINKFGEEEYGREVVLKKARHCPLWINEEGRKYIKDILGEHGVGENEAVIVMAPGARSSVKRWTAEGFTSLADGLSEKHSFKIILAGDGDDKELTERIAAAMRRKPVSLAGRTTVGQLAALIERSEILVTNDSAPLHLGSVAGIPMVAVFGPTDPAQYGPLSRDSRVVRKELSCSPCGLPRCPKNHECMRLLEPAEVLDAAEKILGAK